MLLYHLDSSFSLYRKVFVMNKDRNRYVRCGVATFDFYLKRKGNLKKEVKSQSSAGYSHSPF